MLGGPRRKCGEKQEGRASPCSEHCCELWTSQCVAPQNLSTQSLLLQGERKDGAVYTLKSRMSAPCWGTREGFPVEGVYSMGPQFDFFLKKKMGDNLGKWHEWLRTHSSTCWTLLKGQGVLFN